jgi:integrase
MARRSTGQVVERKTKRGTVYALRFIAGGERQYVTLGTAQEGWNRRRAEDELAATMAAVRSGSWRSPEPVPAPAPEPTFHQFASDWYAAGEPGWGERTRTNYKWQLSHHLLPYFRDHLLRQITVAEVDRYREQKQREGRLSAGTINRTLTRLGQILDVAHERELIDRNPVRVNPKRRKVKALRPRPVYLDSVDQIAAVLDAAATLDAKPKARTAGRRAFMATLIFAGLRIGEACALRRHHVNLPAGRIEVPGSKTDAAAREVDLLPVLRDELGAYLASRGEVGPYEPMFPTARGRHRDINNARQRVVDPVVEEAEKLALQRTDRPLPEGLTAHKLRHTFASLLLAHDPDPANAMAQLGHTDPTFTIRVYTHLMRRSPKEREGMKALIEGTWEPEKAPTGTSEVRSGSEPDLAERNGGAANRIAKR